MYEMQGQPPGCCLYGWCGVVMVVVVVVGLCGVDLVCFPVFRSSVPAQYGTIDTQDTAQGSSFENDEQPAASDCDGFVGLQGLDG